MKINEVEALVGITKKNIRFYEEQGLLNPRRDNRNGYREYGEEEVSVLRQIKLMRKLGVPLEEIRRMQADGVTVADGMRRHLVTLEREQRNLEQSMELCRRLKTRDIRLEDLDAPTLLAEMEQMEQAGTTFLNKQVGDRKAARYVAPVVIALGMIGLMAALMALVLWGYQEDPSIPMLVLVAVGIVPGMVVCGILMALVQRIREIGKGEIDDAKHY